MRWIKDPRWTADAACRHVSACFVVYCRFDKTENRCAEKVSLNFFLCKQNETELPHTQNEKKSQSQSHGGSPSHLTVMWSCFMSGPGLSCDLLNQCQQTGNAERVSQVHPNCAVCCLRYVLCRAMRTVTFSNSIKLTVQTNKLAGCHSQKDSGHIMQLKSVRMCVWAFSAFIPVFT